MATSSVWKNTADNRVYRVAEDGQSKVRVDHLASVVEAFDLFFSGQSSPILANTSDLRTWLNSIPTVV